MHAVNVVAVTVHILLDPDDGKFYVSFWHPGADEPYDGVSELDTLDEAEQEATAEVRRLLFESFNPLSAEPPTPSADGLIWG